MSEQYSSDEDACICNGEVGSRSSHKRKEVHNEVERRRKDKINIGILRLGDLLPDKDPRKQSKNGILERASEYITYLKDLNEKLVMDKVTNMEATVFASLRKQIRELEELNANYARLLTTAGIPLTSGPEEIWDHKPKKYSLKHLPDKQRALLACTEVKTVLQRQQQQQPCQHHGTTPISTRPTAEPHAPKAPQAQVAPAIPPAPPPPASSAREATPGCTLVTQALPSAPVMSTAQPSAVTVFQQQHPLTAVTPTATGVTTGATGGVVSQPILVINDQGVPVLQNVVTFQNTSIILNPQGHAMGARAPGSVVSFTGPDMLPQVHLAAGQSTDDFAHSAAALGGLMHCDPKLKEAAKLCGVQQNAATFLSGAGMVMNQPLLSLGTGATMIAGQTATAPQVPSAFLLPSGQIIPVVSQPQVVSAPMQSAHPLGSQVAANVAAAVSSCSTSLTKVVQCDGTQSYMCREHASSVQNKALTSTPSSSGAAVGTSTVQLGGNCRKQHHSCPQHSSPSTSKCIAVPDSSKTKPVCSHAASKQPLCIRPKPTSQTPDSSQAKSSCARKGGGGKKVAASKSSPELPAKRARTDTPRSDEEAASHTSTCSSTTATTSAQSTEGVSSTSTKDISPLAADILAQATESIFSCGGNVEAAVKQAAMSKNKSPMSASSSDQVTAPAASVPVSVETDTGTQASTTSTASSPPSTSVALTQSHCSKTSVLAEAVCSSETVPANSTVEEVPKMKNIFENGKPTEMDAETTSTTSQVSVESSAQPGSAKEGQDDIQASDSDRNELPSLSLHSIVMEENIDISPSVSSTTFTESYVSVSASGNGHSTPLGSSKVPDCAASILCQLTPPSSKSSEDNSKAFVSSTDSLASDQELPLILSIPEDDGHGSLNSNSNPGLSFPSLSPGDQLEHELGNSNAKAVESTSSLSQFVLTPPTPHLTASVAQVSVTSSTSKKKEPLQSSAYTYVAPESFSTPSSHSGELHTIGNTGSSSKQDCHHASRSPQLHSAPPAKLHTEASCHSFVSNAPPTLPMQSRGLQFSTASIVTAPTQVHNISLPGFSTAQGFATPKEPESMPLLDQTSKPPPSPCRMVRDSGRCTTPSKSPSAQFPMSINPYMTTTPFPFPRPDQYTPCTRTPTSQTNTSNSSNTALSCYSAEALIGTQNFLPSSYRLTPPSCAQVPTTQRSSCQQSSRPQISYSAESLIQSQASNPKKDLQTNAKEPSFSNHSGFVNRLPSYQPQTSTQHTTGLSHQRQLPASSSQQVHLGSTAVSVATDNRSQALPVSTAVPPQPTTVHSSYTAQLGNNAQRSLATTPSRYPIHTYHTAKDDFPMLPSAPLHTPPLHTMAPHMSQSPSSRSHHVQPEANPNQNMFQHQNYPYPNFSLGHRSPSFGTCATSRPEVSATSRVPASCLQATSPRQSHFGMQVPTSQQQGCLFPSASSASLLPLTSEFGPQCSGPLAPPPPPVFGNLSQHCAQAPHLVNNLIPGPFATNGNTICGTSLPPPSVESEKPGGRREKQNMHLMSETSCPDSEKQQSKSKSKKSKPSNTSSHSAVSSIPYFPDFRNESHNHALITLPPPPAPSQKLPHAPSLPSVSTSTSSALPWPHHHQQQQHQQLQHAPQPPHSKPSHTGAEVERSANISSAAYNPLFRPQSQQNSINLNLNGSAAPTPHSSSVASFSHHHSPLQRNTQHSSASTSSVASVVSMTGPSISTTAQVAPYSNCAVAPSQHVPNFNLSNIFPDISSGEQSRASAAPPPPSTHFYPSSRVLHNSFNHILPPPPPPAPTHNNFVHSGHHAPSFSNVIPPLTFPMHEH